MSSSINFDKFLSDIGLPLNIPLYFLIIRYTLAISYITACGVLACVHQRNTRHQASKVNILSRGLDSVTRDPDLEGGDV